MRLELLVFCAAGSCDTHLWVQAAGRLPCRLLFQRMRLDSELKPWKPVHLQIQATQMKAGPAQ